eukprot:Clim_evm45s144 gene=Clim_evmTU45s144
MSNQALENTGVSVTANGKMTCDQHCHVSTECTCKHSSGKRYCLGGMGPNVCKEAPVPKNLVELQDLLREALSSERGDIDYILAVMANYASNADDWKQYAFYAPHRYTRNLVDVGNGAYNLMILCWSEGQASSVHDHADSHCFMKLLEGELIEELYEMPEDHDGRDESLTLRSRTTLEKNAVAYIDDKIGLHRMVNASHTRRAASLHLYCPPYDKCKAFDVNTGHAKRCGNIVFYSQMGEKI